MSQRSLSILTLSVALATVSLTLAACGSSGTNQDELDQARKEGAAQTRQQMKIQHIEQQLKSLKHGHATSQNETGTTTSGGATSCGGTLSVGSNTTCGFAANVEADYYSEIGSGSGTVISYSPTTGRYYTMYCTGGEPHQCTGGNDASVYFR